MATVGDSCRAFASQTFEVKKDETKGKKFGKNVISESPKTDDISILAESLKLAKNSSKSDYYAAMAAFLTGGNTAKTIAQA